MTGHHFIFFQLSSDFWQLPKAKKQDLLADGEEILGRADIPQASYSLLGLRPECAFMVWWQADSVEQMQTALGKFLSCRIGKYLTPVRTLFGLARSSVYVHHHDGQSQATNLAKKGEYLILYPFTKTADWYLLPFARRQKMMLGHVRIGRSYPQISQLLLSSTGLDSQEFVVAYTADRLEEFQDLVIELRSTAVRRYTQSDNPVFTCRRSTLTGLIGR